MKLISESDLPDFYYGAPVGLVSPSKSHEITPNEFTFWVSMMSVAKFKLQLGDIIVAKYVPGTQPNLWDKEDTADLTFGIITSMVRASDVDTPLTDYVRHGFGKKTSSSKTEPLEALVITCKFLRNLTDRMRPVDSCPVYFATAAGIKFATQEVKADGSPQLPNAWIPVGLYTTGYGIRTPICCNEDFILGPDAAHVNVSGQSGMAAKTSYLLFLLSSLLQKTTKRVGVVFINTKKSDFLWIDKPNPLLTLDKQEMYKDLGLTPGLPFSNVEIWAPVHQSASGTRTIKSLRPGPLVKEIQLGWLDFQGSISSLVSTDDFDIKAENVLQSAKDRVAELGVHDRTFTSVLETIDGMLSGKSKSESSEKNSHHEATVRKVKSRMIGMKDRCNEILDPAAVHSKFPRFADLSHGEAVVLDIALIKDARLQQVVFKTALQKCEAALQQEGEAKKLDAIVVVADELNAFCSESKSEFSALRKQIIDIAARGRSTGFILFGAEQAASKVADEVYGAAATKIIGRTGPEESTAHIYQFLPRDLKGQISRLQQGKMIVSAVTCPEHIPIEFPYPPVATDSTIGKAGPE